MAKALQRNIYLKQIKYDTRPGSDFTPPAMDELLRNVFSAARTARDRHMPEVIDDEEFEEGTVCRFIDQRSISHSTPGIGFRFGTYVVGEIPQAMHPTLTDENADSQPITITDPETGEELQTVIHTSILVWNQVLLMENVRGAGGTSGLTSCLRGLLRRYIDPQFPQIKLVDVSAHEVVAAIERGRGVREIEMDLASSQASNNSRYGHLLQQAKQLMGNVKLGRLLLRGEDGEIPTDGALEIVEEFEEGELDQIRLHLNNGETIRGDQLRVRKPVVINDVGGRNPDRIQLLRQMRIYLTELRSESDGVRIIDSDGTIALE